MAKGSGPKEKKRLSKINQLLMSKANSKILPA